MNKHLKRRQNRRDKTGTEASQPVGRPETVDKLNVRKWNVLYEVATNSQQGRASVRRRFWRVSSTPPGCLLGNWGDKSYRWLDAVRSPATQTTATDRSTGQDRSAQEMHLYIQWDKETTPFSSLCDILSLISADTLIYRPRWGMLIVRRLLTLLTAFLHFTTG